MFPRRALLTAAVSSAIALAGAGQAQAADGSCDGRGIVPTEENVGDVLHATLCLVNQERADRDLPRLSTVKSLETVARTYARRMVRQQFFEHTSPDGGTFLSRIKSTSYLDGGLRRWTVGENLAWGSGERATPGGIVEAWMASPGHRRNILDGRFRELGLGVAIGAPRVGVGGAAATYVNTFGLRRR